MTKWLTSDLHVGHKRITEFTDRKLVTTAEEHDDWVVDLWNSQVKPGDVVYILGDISFARFDKTCEALEKMQGQKHIIKGNHDRADDLDRLKAANLIQNWHDYKEIKVGNKEDNLTACLFHFPITSWHRQHYGSFMLHGHCLDTETELLTTSGWKSLGNFSVGDEVWSYNPTTKLLEKDAISHIYSPIYTGDMFTLKGKSVNARMTADHRMVGVSAHSNKFLEFTPSDTPKSPVKLIHSGFKTNLGLPWTDDLLRLYVYCAADGTLKEGTKLWRVRVKKEHKLKALRSCLKNLNIHYNEYLSAGYTSFNFYCPEFGDMQVKGLDRKLVDMTSKQFEVFLDAYSLSDGNRNGNGVIVYTSKPSEKDLIQELAITNGFSCTTHTRSNHGFSANESYQLSIYPRQSAIAWGVQKMEVNPVYNEQVWCIKNRNANFFIRREGKSHLTGNCHGSFQGEGKILDVGIDNSYNIFGEHKLFSEEDVLQFMQGREVYIAESHRNCKER